MLASTRPSTFVAPVRRREVMSRVYGVNNVCSCDHVPGPFMDSVPQDTRASWRGQCVVALSCRPVQISDLDSLQLCVANIIAIQLQLHSHRLFQ